MNAPPIIPRPQLASLHGGFTLVELLVAMAVLALLLGLFAQMVEQSQRSVAGSERHLDSDRVARSAFALLAEDVTGQIVHDFLPLGWNKQAGNDALAFYTTRPGYSGNRDASWVEYRVNPGSLKRGVQGMEFGAQDVKTSAQESLIRAYPSADGPSIEAADRVAEGVIRLETAFLVRRPAGAGTDLKAAPPQRAASPGEIDIGNVDAVVVSLVVLAPRWRAIVNDSAMARLAAQFPDAEDAQSTMTRWQAVADDPAALAAAADIPLAAAQAVKIYERTFYLP